MESLKVGRKARIREGAHIHDSWIGKVGTIREIRDFWVVIELADDTVVEEYLDDFSLNFELVEG